MAPSDKVGADVRMEGAVEGSVDGAEEGRKDSVVEGDEDGPAEGLLDSRLVSSMGNACNCALVGATPQDPIHRSFQVPPSAPLLRFQEHTGPTGTPMLSTVSIRFQIILDVSSGQWVP